MTHDFADGSIPDTVLVALREKGVELSVHECLTTDYARRDSVIAAMTELGYSVGKSGCRSGNVESIYIRPDGTLVGGADRRRSSKAIGY